MQAAAARPEAPWRMRLALVLVGLVTAGMAALGTAIWFVRHPKQPQSVVVQPQVWEVAPGQGTIADAIRQAQPRDRIVVRAGEYREQIVLKSGVTIVSDPPRGAVLRGGAGTQGPAVLAVRVNGARLSGFSIQGDTQMPLSAGIVLSESSVEIDDVEVAGAEVGVVIRGGGRSALRGSRIHDCVVGVLASGAVEPWISHNAIVKNRKAGVAAADGARPALSGNVFDRNKLELPPDVDMKAVREHNFVVGGGTAGAATPSGSRGAVNGAGGPPTGGRKQ
jgi:hypothetical protein